MSDKVELVALYVGFVDRACNHGVDGSRCEVFHSRVEGGHGVLSCQLGRFADLYADVVVYAVDNVGMLWRSLLRRSYHVEAERRIFGHVAFVKARHLVAPVDYGGA